jgi:hypothetical protein
LTFRKEEDTVQTVLLVAITVVALVAIGVMLHYAREAWRSQSLRRRFGPEYDRAIQSAGDQRAGERALAARQERRRHFELHELEPAARAEFAERWLEVQARFVDTPAESVRDADALVNELMERMGYPIEGFEQTASHVSVDHPREVEDYRAGHAVSVTLADDGTSTEDMRRGLMHYRSLFESLLGQEASPRTARSVAGDSEYRARSLADQR